MFLQGLLSNNNRYVLKNNDYCLIRGLNYMFSKNNLNESKRISLVGPPGGGKGTISQYIIDDFEMEQISTGDLLRAEINKGSEFGKNIEGILNRGDLVPDEDMLSIVENAVSSLPTDRGFILDGYPRTPDQAESVIELLNKLNMPLDKVYYIDVPQEEILKRLSDRLIHKPSGRVYNLHFNPPKQEGIDDVTGEPLTQRDDDKPVNILSFFYFNFISLFLPSRIIKSCFLL
eukprot:TRINITY_DN2194_c0_g1_i2.p1 TRINITY_DN2194_c0_g1~~TRINITY_DN2194_c0_g1_i2.p1  ORF type:complete len:231 (+),score=54.99 TRINITY_DN2194_c0_g1_i2:537-1229(+)